VKSQIASQRLYITTRDLSTLHYLTIVNLFETTNLTRQTIHLNKEKNRGNKSGAMDTNRIDDLDIAFDLQAKRLELIDCLERFKRATHYIHILKRSMRDLKVRYMRAQQEHNQPLYHELFMLYCLRESDREDLYKYSEIKYTRIMYLRRILYRETVESERVVGYIHDNQIHPGKDR